MRRGLAFRGLVALVVVSIAVACGADYTSSDAPGQDGGVDSAQPNDAIANANDATTSDSDVVAPVDAGSDALGPYPSDPASMTENPTTLSRLSPRWQTTDVGVRVFAGWYDPIKATLCKFSAVGDYYEPNYCLPTTYETGPGLFLDAECTTPIVVVTCSDPSPTAIIVRPGAPSSSGRRLRREAVRSM